MCSVPENKDFIFEQRQRQGADMPDIIRNQKICPALLEILQGVLSNVFCTKCSPECQVYHKSLYLEHCLTSCIVPENLEHFIDDDASYVRRLAQLIAIRHRCTVRNMASDPIHEIRALHLYMTEDFADLLKAIDDENKCTRICIINRMRQSVDRLSSSHGFRLLPPAPIIRMPESLKEAILLKMSRYINDRHYLVRLEFVRLLHKFTGLSSRFICKLFDKKNIGLFIYGAEDERPEVRQELIRSIETFVMKSTAPSIFEYLVDMLNDDAEVVRETVVSILCKLARRYSLSVQDEQITSIMNGLNENNVEIKEGVLQVISNLKYTTIDIYFHMISQPNLEASDVIRCLQRLISRNRKLFIANLSKIYVYCPFNENKLLYRTGESSLYNVEYLAELALLKVLSKHFKIRIPGPVRASFRFLEMKLYQEDSAESDDAIDRMCALVLQLLGAKVQYKSDIFDAFDRDDPAISFLAHLYFALDARTKNGDEQLFIKLVHTFGIEKRARDALAPEGADIFANGLEQFNCEGVVHFLNTLQRQGSYRDIRMYEFAVSVPSELTLHNCLARSSCAQFMVYLYYGPAADNVRFIVEDPVSGGQLQYRLSSQVFVVIDECPDDIDCYIAAVYPPGIVKLSQTQHVKFLKL